MLYFMKLLVALYFHFLAVSPNPWKYHVAKCTMGRGSSLSSSAKIKKSYLRWSSRAKYILS